MSFRSVTAPSSPGRFSLTLSKHSLYAASTSDCSWTTCVTHAIQIDSFTSGSSCTSVSSGALWALARTRQARLSECRADLLLACAELFL